MKTTKQKLNFNSDDGYSLNQLKIISPDDYNFENKISEDPFHQYFQVKNKSTGVKYTAKILTCPHYDQGDDLEYLQNFIFEIEILSNVNSRFISKCQGCNLDNETQDPFYIFEYYSKGTLSELISQKKEITNFQKHKIIYGIASCMEKVHTKGIVHRDLRPSNIYIDDNLLPKVSGFGLSILKKNISENDEPVGTMRFMAPELYDVSKKYDESIDVYAFSVIMYFVFTDGSYPKFSLSSKMNGKIPKIPQRVPHCYAELIKKCMSFNPKKRPSFYEIVSILKSDDFFTSENEKNRFKKFIEGQESIFKQYGINQIEIIQKIDSDYSGDYFEAYDKNNEEKMIGKTLKINEINYQKIISKIEKVSHFYSNFIIQYKGFTLNETFQPSIFYDYYQNTLYDFISNTKECTETTKLKIIYGIASEMNYLHSEGIIHPDLNPRYIYIDDDFLPKIGNFDVSQFIKDKDQLILKNSIMYPFLAPEILKEEDFDFSVDVYSFSNILYFICTGELPKIRMNKKTRGEIPSIPDIIPNHYAKLIKRCMSFDSKQRPTFDEIENILKSKEFITNEINEEEYSSFLNKYDIKFEKVKIKYTEINHLEVDFDPIDLSLYEKESFIGSGSYGDVFKVIEKSTNNLYAAKINHLQLEDCGPIEIYNLSREINILSKMNNKSILKFIGYNENNFDNERCPTIITELSKNISLGRIIDLKINGKTHPEWDHTKSLICAYGIAAGMSYIHSLDIIHRDLKPENIFLDEYLHPKIGDFGFSKELNDETAIDTDDYIGTPIFISPETYNSFTYSKAGDVYAYSILLYELFTNEYPYHEIGYYNLINSVTSGRRPVFKHYIRKCYKNLIVKCWANDPKKRPTFDEIMTILEDEEFITEEINKEEYQDYISFIKNQKYKKSFNQIHIDFESITNKLIKELSTKIYCIDLNKYIKKKFIRREGNFKIYEIMNKETKEHFEAKKSTIIIFYLSSKEMIHLQREINILSKIKHPIFLKFIGISLVDFAHRPMPVLVTEMPPNNSLFNLLQMERNGKHNKEWDDTEKLITIYGIASGMSYLHSHEVIHRNLSPESIFFDEYLHPKIGNFGLLTQIHSNKSITHQTTNRIKGNIIYASPELLENSEYSKSSDVYAFSLIVYEIMTNKIPFENIQKNLKSIIKEVVTKNNRPKINIEISECYRKLIESCWLKNPEERPTFDMIEEELTSNSSFITKTIDKTKFNKYVKFIKKSNKQYYSQNESIKIEEIINNKKTTEKEKTKTKKNKKDESKSNENKQKEESNHNKEKLDNGLEIESSEESEENVIEAVPYYKPHWIFPIQQPTRQSNKQIIKDLQTKLSFKRVVNNLKTKK